jgi:hypothetical protein
MLAAASNPALGGCGSGDALSGCRYKKWPGPQGFSCGQQSPEEGIRGSRRKEEVEKSSRQSWLHAALKACLPSCAISAHLAHRFTCLKRPHRAPIPKV